MLALRYQTHDGVVQVRRLHRAFTQVTVQRAIDAAIAARTAVAFWTDADEELVIDPHACSQLQVLELGLA